jgi:tetratricopeptide (TPR) repeat protein
MRARLAIERERAGLEQLAACAEAYRRLDFPRGLANVLIDLSQLAHQRGDVAAAIRYRQETLELADDSGLGLVRDNFGLALADLLMRNSDYGAAIELCQAAIATAPSRFFIASYEQLLASAYTFVKDAGQAIAHVERALQAFEALGADASASVAATKLAADLIASQEDAFWDQAEALLARWIPKDEAQGRIADAIWKRELLADSALSRFLYSRARRGELGLLDAAQSPIGEAEQAARQLPPREAAQRTGNLWQLRARIAQGRGDSAGSEEALRQASRVYESAGFDFEAANCRYLIGTLRLNSANEQLMPSFGESETNLKAALAYYEGALMRSQAGDARFMIARLYANAVPRIDRDIGDRMLDAALEHLTDGEAGYDAVRRDYATGSAIEAQRGKRTFVSASRRIYELALDITAYFHIMAVSDGPDGAGHVDYYRLPVHGDFVPVVLRVMGCAEPDDLTLIDGVSVHPLDHLRREWLAEDGKQDGCA